MTRFNGKIYDQKYGQWYEIDRGWNGSLRLKKVWYRHVTHFPTPGDMIILDNVKMGSIEIVDDSKPPTPNPIRVKKQ